MRDTLKWLSMKIRKKTTMSLKCATIIFAITTIAVAVYMVFIINEQVNVNKNFYNNDNTHIITIHNKIDKYGSHFLDLKDKEKIINIIKKTGYLNSCIISNEYKINYGINSDKDSYFITAYDEEIYSKLGINLKDGEAISTDLKNDEEIVLYIPKVDEMSGEMVAKDYINMKININSYKKNNIYFIRNQHFLYVNYNTLKKMSLLINGLSENDESVLETENINSILIYVDDFDNVRKIAKSLEKNNYNINYTLSAFENLGESLKESKTIGFIILFVLFLIAVVNMILSSEIYLRNSQKDMGILRHYGYDKEVVNKVYSINFRNIFFKVGCISLSLEILCSFIWIKCNLIINSLIVMPIVVGMLIIVYFIIKSRIGKYVNKEILHLIKFSKENE